MESVSTTEQLSQLVRASQHLRVLAGGTKPAAHGAAAISLAKLTGLRQYDPGEFTFTAYAGTPLKQIQQLLLEKGQCLPFDPPMVEAGATLGGTVATGLSGAGRLRYGGVRDFLLGAQLVLASGEVVSTGSKVVKNAAGFDFPKLFVGSLGQFGIATELTLKVFPTPESHATVEFECSSLNAACDTMKALATSNIDLSSLDMDDQHRVYARISGSREGVARRAAAVSAQTLATGKVLSDEQDEQVWHGLREFQWASDKQSLVKVAITPDKITKLAKAIEGAPFRISVGGHLAWIAWPNGEGGTTLDTLLKQLDCPGVALTGDWDSPLVGQHCGSLFADRIQSALDPTGKFSIKSMSTA